MGSKLMKRQRPEKTAGSGQAGRNDGPIIEEELRPPPVLPSVSSPTLASFGRVVGVTVAVERIHRRLRRVVSFRRAMRAQEWRLFTAIDQAGEEVDLKVAEFMKSIFEFSNSIEEPVLPSSPPPPLQRPSFDPEALSKIIVITESATNEADFKLPAGPITPKIANLIIDLCRSGGRLNMSDLLRLLRNVFRVAKSMPNLTRVALNQAKCVVVGDLHGQLQDLLFILENAGLPAPAGGSGGESGNYYVFNGDWVDRGPNSIECVTIIFSLFVAYPGLVALNRGNHEEAIANAAYGFKNECDEKYPWVHEGESEAFTHRVFVEVFRVLPLFTLLNDKIYIMHGGLPCHKNLVDGSPASLKDLDDIPREDYENRPNVPYTELPSNTPSEIRRREWLKQMMRDTLWSDPHPDVNGLACNPRGTGSFFGPNITREWMAHNNVSMVIRSHECVDQGLCLPYHDESSVRLLSRPNGETSLQIDISSGLGEKSQATSPPLLLTLFSASNYTGHCNNRGAYLTIMPHNFSNATPIPNTELFFRITRYKLTHATLATLMRSNRASLHNLLIRHRAALLSTFQSTDSSSSGYISRLEWAQVMQRVVGLEIRWLAIIDGIMPSSALSGPNKVDYQLFISSLTKVGLRTDRASASSEGTAVSLVERLYRNRKHMEQVFKLIDRNGDGLITETEMASFVENIKKKLGENSPHREHLEDLASVFAQLDRNHDGVIDINEFFESSRYMQY